MKKLRGKYIIYVLVVAMVIVLAGGGAYLGEKKLTYLESRQLTLQFEKTYAIKDTKTIIEQAFIMPYQIFQGVKLRIGTYDRDNNSEWSAELHDTNGMVLYKWEFNANIIEDGDCYLTVSGNLKVRQGEKYILRIKAERVHEESALAFSSGIIEKNDMTITGMSYGGEATGSTLSMYVYGGTQDIWWVKLNVSLLIMALVILGYAWWLFRGGKTILRDTKMQALLLGAVIFLLLLPCAKEDTGLFLDEFDNVIGGLLIRQGRVLYRDYYTQHTPLGYYICALFARLGAESIQQMRIMYYLGMGVFWALAYIRYSKIYGKKEMIILPILQIVFFTTMYPQGAMIIADGLETIFMTVVLLEFLAFIDDRTMTVGRGVILSISICGAIGSTFVSVYPLAIIGLGVLWLEIGAVFVRKEYSFKIMCMKYVSLGVPLGVIIACIIGYFGYHDSLKALYLQAYKFNTTIYSYYLNGYGNNIIQPFFTGIRNFFSSIIINGTFDKEGTAQIVMVLQLVIQITFICVIIRMIQKKKIYKGIILFLFVCVSATRGKVDAGGGFHWQTFWCMMIALIVVLYKEMDLKVTRGARFVISFAIILVLSGQYVVKTSDNLFVKQKVIASKEAQVIDLTKPGEGVFADAVTVDCVYLLYKDRHLINRSVFVLPWYMDWFEEDAIADIEEHSPSVIIWNEEQNVWKRTNFCPRLESYIADNYLRPVENLPIWEKRVAP